MCDVFVPHVQPISTELLYCFSSVFVELLSSIFILQPKFGPTSHQTRHSDEENLSVGCSPLDNHRRLNVYFKFHTLQVSLLSSDVISLWILTTATAASLVTLTTYGILSAVGGSLTPQVWTTEEVEARLPLPSVILGGATGIYRSKKRRFCPLIHHKEGTLCQHATTKWLFQVRLDLYHPHFIHTPIIFNFLISTNDY